ncbi:MAG: DUF349 domain-containing protein [Propionibacteriaceae bacterium]|jgi:hypothetical protein|nr:DUF349 domain-containing protein [Propionibacteriaceae bacterium]
MSETTPAASFGRVEEDGTVYVITADGERKVGQVPDVTPAEALTFFERRFEGLAAEVELLIARVHNKALSPEEARKSMKTLRASIPDANAVGDLQGLLTKLDALAPELDNASEARKAERAAAAEATKEAKEGMVAEAEKLAESNDWKEGVNRFRALLDEWKALPRIDRATDDDLWHRFSAARTTYTRRRKAQFTQWAEEHAVAQGIKEQIIAEAAELSTSTEWGATAAAFRELMDKWKAAGSAGRELDEKLWKKFRGLQDTFWAARTENSAARDTEFQANLEAKEALLAEAEATMLPVTDVNAARSALRSFLSRYNEYGNVPRAAMAGLDARIRALDAAVKGAEEANWKRTDPEAKKRAQDTVEMFTAQIAKLTTQIEAAEGRGDKKQVAKLQESIVTYTEWRDQAAKTLADYE